MEIPEIPEEEGRVENVDRWTLPGVRFRVFGWLGGPVGMFTGHATGHFSPVQGSVCVCDERVGFVGPDFGSGGTVDCFKDGGGMG